MNSLYDDDIDEFDSIDVKSKKKEIKEESKSYNRKILDKCISIILETIYYLVFFIYKVIKSHEKQKIVIGKFLEQFLLLQ